MPSESSAAPTHDEDSLDALSLARLPITHPALRKARIVKNGRLKSVIELYRDRTAGSGQYAVEDLAATLGVLSSHSDLLLLRYVALMPSFDVFSLRLLLRDIGFPEEKLVELALAPGHAEAVGQAVKRSIEPLLREADVPDLPALEVALREGASAPAVQRLMQKLTLPPDAAVRFVRDYLDTFHAIALYEVTLNSIKPQIGPLVETVKKLAQEPQVRNDRTLLSALSEVVTVLPELVSSAGKRLAAVEKVAATLWNGSSGVALRTQQKQVREFQILVAFILCGIAAKITAWHHAFPREVPSKPVKNAGLIAGEMAHALADLREAAAKGTRATSFPAEVLRLSDKGNRDSFRALLRSLGPDKD